MTMGSLMMMFLLPGYGVWKTTLSRIFWKEKTTHVYNKFLEVRTILVGGFKHFLFSPLFVEDEPILTVAYFSKGLVQPPTRISLAIFCQELDG